MCRSGGTARRRADELPAEAARGGDVAAVAAAIVVVMDGLRVRWLLDPDAVDMAAATQRTIGACSTPCSTA